MSAEISVIIAARNAEKTLPAALESVLKQSRLPADILLVLNGCSDATPQVAHAWAQFSPLIRIAESSPDGGVAEAAKVGCQLANSPLLARMDADDLCHPDRLAAQFVTLEREKADLVTCRVSPLDALGQGIVRYVDWANSLREPQDFATARFIESPVIQPGVLMTQKAYERAGGYRVQEGPEDYDLWLRMLASGARFSQAQDALLSWRDSATRLTRTHDDYSVEQMTQTKARHLARLPSVEEHGVVIAGAGPQGRRMTRLLLKEGVEVHELYDVDPRKVGSSAHGRPILAASGIRQGNERPVLLGCVGRGGREKISRLAEKHGYEAGKDYFACC